MKATLLAEDFDYDSKTFRFKVFGDSSETLDLRFDQNMYPEGPNVTVEGEGKDNVEIVKGGDEISIKLGDGVKSREVEVILSA